MNRPKKAIVATLELLKSAATASSSTNSLHSSDTVGTIPGLLKHRALESGDQVAFERESDDGWQATTWSEYATSVERLSTALMRCGLHKGDAICLAIPTSAEWELLHFAALRCGLIVVGIDPKTSQANLLKIMHETKCRSLVVEDIAKTSQRVLAETNCQFLVTTERGPVLRNPARPIFTFDQLTRAASFNSGAVCSSYFPLPLSSDPATIIYTSGTTGEPRGIVYTHAQILQAVKAVVEIFSMTKDDTTICWLPLSSLFQRMVNLASVSQGAKIVFLKDPRKLMQHMKTVKPTIVFGVPRFYEKIHEQIWFTLSAQPTFKRVVFRAALKMGSCRSVLSRLPFIKSTFKVIDDLCFKEIRDQFGGAVRLMISGSAPLGTNIVDFFNALDFNLLEAYALSENIMPMSTNRISDRRSGSVGKPLRDNDVRIASDGEIVVRGPGVFPGYLGDHSSASLFTDTGFYKTGDLGFIDKDGFLFIEGRKSETVKSSTGKKLSLNYIEQQYKASFCIDQIVAIGAGRKCVVALITLSEKFNHVFEDNSAMSEKQIDDLKLQLGREFNRIATGLEDYQRIKGYAILRHPFACETGEMTTSLKLRRKVIAEKYETIVESIYQKIDSSFASKQEVGRRITDGCSSDQQIPKPGHFSDQVYSIEALKD